VIDCGVQDRVSKFGGLVLVDLWYGMGERIDFLKERLAASKYLRNIGARGGGGVRFVPVRTR
jgi:hypothetical protein